MRPRWPASATREGLKRVGAVRPDKVSGVEKGPPRKNCHGAHSSRSAAVVAAGFGRPPLGSLEDVGKATRAKVEDEQKTHKNMIQSVLENFSVV